MDTINLLGLSCPSRGLISMLQVDSMVMPLQPALAEVVAMLLEERADVNGQGGMCGNPM